MTTDNPTDFAPEYWHVNDMEWVVGRPQDHLPQVSRSEDVRDADLRRPHEPQS
ncbi:hypothetical protein V1283_006000 [Bradyrhizobium sp. AZCC 2262]|uniref:hypothetical protein n=1 Tax=Bradyrhizobium sp. AZCC 2262 TaxID=3117022 RepID=UPI002FEF9605